MRFIQYTLFGTVLLFTPGDQAGAQASVEADSIAAAGDTIGALLAFDAILRRHPDNGNAHYRLGRLHRALFLGTPDTTLSLRRRRNWDRDRAERHFRRVTEIAPDSAQYWLAWAELLRTKTSMVSRFRVMDLVDSSVAAAQRAAHGRVIADVGYRAARVEWERYEQMGHRYLFWGSITGVDDSLFYSDWHYVERLFTNWTKPDPGHPGDRQKRMAEEYLRWALDANPEHVRAAGMLAVVLGDDGRWEEAHELSRRTVRAAPSSGKGWAILGLTLARLDRWQEAQAAFDTAFTRMTPQERAPYDNLELILRAADRRQFSERQPAEQDELRRLYWAVAQPLFLRDVNEPETEYFARITYVYHRWSDDLELRPGYDTDRGRVYVRWGPPDVWAVFGRDRLTREVSRDVLTAWVYRRARLRFLFGGVPGLTRTVFAGFFHGRAVYRESQHNHPVRFDNVPTVAEMDTIHVQLAQFRPDDTTGTDVVAYSFAPLGRLANVDIDRVPVTTGIIVKDAALRDVVGGIGDVTGLSALGDDRVVLEYDNDVAIGPGAAQAEYLVLDLRSDQQVTYEIELTVIDRSTGQAATVSRQFQITSTPLRRGPP